MHDARFAFKLPDTLSLEEGALVEPLAIGINAAMTGGVTLGDEVVVFGAGCIGLVALLAAKAFGASKVIQVDLLPRRLEAAAAMGAVPVDARSGDPVAEVLRLTDGRGARVVIDCAGANETLCQSVRVARTGGSIVWVGLAADVVNGLPITPISTRELTIRSIFRYRNLYPTTLSAIADGRIDIRHIISNRYRFEDAPRAFAESWANRRDIVKSILVVEPADAQA